MQLIAATDFSTRSNRAVRQAGLLAKRESAELYIVYVVDDDQPEKLMIERREAERLLAEQITSMAELRDVRARSMVIVGDPFDGILRVAAEINPALIVMGSHRKQLLLDIFVGTTVERVIRKSSWPVLMVNHEAQREYDRTIVALDLSDASARALRAASSTGLVKNGATLIHAFSVARGKLFVAQADRETIDSYIASERQRAVDQLVSILITNDFQRQNWTIRVEEGAPMEVIARTVSELNPDLPIMASGRRSMLLRTLIGSVTEVALRSLNVDILVVPARE
jgi:nucleotide-binding universal stress UspA family protein